MLDILSQEIKDPEQLVSFFEEEKLQEVPVLGDFYFCVNELCMYPLSDCYLMFDVLVRLSHSDTIHYCSCFNTVLVRIKQHSTSVT